MGDAGYVWKMLPHVSRCCYARVLVRQDAGGAPVYHCANCGLDVAGGDVSVICACGLPGVRCQVNEDPTPEYPGEIVAAALGGAA